MLRFFLSLGIALSIASCAQLSPTRTPVNITKLSDSVYLHTTLRQTQNWGQVVSNGLIIIKNQQALLIDTGWGEEPTAEILHWLDQRQIQLRLAVLTHWHDDRAGGLPVLQQRRIPTLTYQKTQQLLEHAGIVVPVQSFTDPAYQVSFNDLEIEIYHPGPGHTLDNTVVWVESEQLLFGGCLIRPAAARSMGNTADGDIDYWATAVVNVQQRYPTVRRIIPSHGAVGDQHLLQHTINLAQQAANMSDKR